MLSNSKRDLYITYNFYKMVCEKFDIKKSVEKHKHNDFKIILNVGCIVPLVFFSGFDGHFLF